ncbi:ATP synthase alpha subunit, nucleotide-binding domain protein (macronuclear) [Tetrahymena thermophila SB210]|uniref:ATP synthase alpha subunit, nucleotide-binding domain protein n=1 Tax=Tetrahymena thermophila (strain SB210) TaxID=312017 RepID=Q24FC1_TETTS|nr:ATP synthase alpha subunit, nucleotide-binding domain protein [Tetrahymena thermophila SB210]EAS06537.1 ATP synthase alpha subunit, nucleotide-binding domain protein [Tetrahymena thermophila SB210]|eukprot:XP_001026782.1 ATP synthase alpha subunit, nucleotide-binding domain protein [Tetrahymena thermophila SB210]
MNNLLLLQSIKNLTKGVAQRQRLFAKRYANILSLSNQIQYRFCAQKPTGSTQEEDSSLYALNNKIYEIKDNAQTGQIVKSKNDIIYFTNFEKSRLKLKSLIQLENDAQKQALVLSLNEKISSALCLNRIDHNQNYLDQSIKLENPNGLKLQLNGKQICGKVINYRGEVIKEFSPQPIQEGEVANKQSENHNDFDVEFTLLDYKEHLILHQKRLTSKRQLYTGNISVDMTQPICQGNFVILNGDLNTGKSHLASEMIKQNCALNPNTVGIFVTQHFSTAEKVLSELQSNEHSKNNFIIVSPQNEETAGMAEKYLSPFTALHLARKIQQEQSKDVIIIYDNIYDHLYSENLIFGQIDMPSGFKSVLKELFSMSGYYGDRNGSISSICIFDSNRAAEKYQKETQKLYQEAESYADVIVDFTLNDPLYRQTRPKIQLKGKKLFSKPKWQNNLYLEVAKELHQVLIDLQQQSKEIQLKNDLKITVEPWDYYLYYDSKYFMKLLVSSNYFTPIEQIVFVKFIVKCIHEETISQFKETPQELTKSFMKFCKEFKEFNKQDIFSYIQNEFNYNDNEIQPNTLDNLQHCVLRLYELFIMHCKMNDKLLPFKKDYFN